jgi:NH3-dependent NAD+ synthetase
LGVHYAKSWPPAGKTAEQVERMLELNPNMEWMQLSVMPWLAAQIPGAQLVIDPGIDASSDHQRWSALMSRALAGADPRQPLETAGTYWVVGTHNATERALMTYSNISCAVSVQPLVGLWKSDVLAICHWLGVPEIAIERSRQADCDCGRFDTAAAHIAEVDAILMCRAGDMPRSWLQAGVEPALLETLEAFVEEQIRYAGFKASIPYSPEPGQVVRCL